MTESHTLAHWQESCRVQAETIRRLVAALEKIAAADTRRCSNGDAVYGGFARIAREALTP